MSIFRPFLFALILTSSVAFAGEGDILQLSDEAAKVYEADACARASVDAVMSLIFDEVMEAGVDWPDEVLFTSIAIGNRGEPFYVLFVENDGPFFTETKRTPKGCEVIGKAERPGLEPATSRSN